MCRLQGHAKKLCQNVYREDVLRVFIYADMDKRVERGIKEYGMEATTARKEMEKSDKERSHHYNIFTDKTWGIATIMICSWIAINWIMKTVQKSSALWLRKCRSFLEQKNVKDHGTTEPQESPCGFLQGQVFGAFQFSLIPSCSQRLSASL